jgi:hypothetical protein
MSETGNTPTIFSRAIPIAFKKKAIESSSHRVVIDVGALFLHIPLKKR